MAGSGALSHVYIQYPPFRCNIPGALGVMYDDGNRLLLVPAPTKVFSWPVSRYPHTDSPSVTAIDDGPVLAVRFSLDGKILAIQRSDSEIAYFNIENGLKFFQPGKSRTERILGFFWTDCPTCDIVYVTSNGLELYSLSAGMDSLKLVDVKLSNVSWYVYTHESRLVLLASGMQCKTFLGYQFSAGGIIRLPKFDASMTKEEANRKPVLSPKDVHIATMYGRLYCLQVDRVAMELNIYRFYRDAVVPQGSLPIYSENVAISVVDGVLLVHQIASKVVLLYDILSDMKTPISAPLPLLLRLTSENNGSPASYLPGSPVSNNLEGLTLSESNTYGDGWTFVNPDIILDQAHGLLWRIHLDLEAIAASSSDVPSLLAFLQRRRLDIAKAKQLSFTVLRSTIVEKRPLCIIADAMDVITLAYSHSAKTSSSSAPKQAASIAPQSAPAEHQHANGTTGTDSPTIVSGTVSVTSKVLEGSGLVDQDQTMVRIEREGQDVSSMEVSSSADNSSQEAQDDVNSTEVNSKSGDISCSPVQGSSVHTIVNENNAVGNATQNAGKSALDVEEARLSQEQFPPGESSQKSVTHTEKAMDTIVQTSAAGITAISPDEMHRSVFRVIEEEVAVESTFLAATIIEYMRSAAAEKLKIPPGLQVLVVQLLARDERYAELWHFIYSKILEPSRELALQLLQAGKSHPPTNRLGLDMLKQLCVHADYISVLLQQGRLLEALRYARQNRVEAIPPSTFLESAAATQDAQKLACVLRFCLDFVPNFEQTSEYSTYLAVLKQDCVTVAG